jgi:sugar-specific transcriptional regulator TrmB
MPSTSKVLDDARDLVKKRLAELDEERRRLEQALGQLGGKKSGRRPGRPRGKASKKSRKKAAKKTARKAVRKTGRKTARRRGRRGGTRADQAVALIQKKPGITASEIAKTMKIKPNYLYRVLSDLEKQKRVKKKGRTYRAA